MAGPTSTRIHAAVNTYKNGRFSGPVDNTPVEPPLSEFANVNTVTPEHLEAWSGKALPGLMYRGGDAAGADELVNGVDNLADSSAPNAPTKEVASVALDGLTTQFAVSTNKMVAASPAVGNFAAEAFLAIFVIEVLAHSNNRSIGGNRDGSSPNAGWEISTTHTTFLGTTSGFNFQTDGTVGTSAINTTLHHAPGTYVIMIQREITGTLMGIYTKVQTRTQTRSTQDMTSLQALCIGDNDVRGASLSHRFGMYAQWTGVDAEGWTEAERLAVAEGLQLE